MNPMKIRILFFVLTTFSPLLYLAADAQPIQNSLYQTNIPLLWRDMIPLSERSLSFDDGQNIFVVSSPGSIPTNITNNSTTDTLYSERVPVWSVRSNRVAYMTINQETLTSLWVTGRHGNDKMLVDQNVILIGWSPVREQLAYFQPVGNNAITLKVFEVTTQSYSPIFTGNLLEAEWSSDGNSIAFTYRLQDSTVQLATWILHGGEIRVLATANIDIDFEWSPKTDMLAFSRNDGSDFGDIFIIKPNGTQLQQLTFTNDQKRYLQWSPNGDYIVYTSTSTSNNDEGIYTLLVSDRTYKYQSGAEERAYWSGDSRYVSFASPRVFAIFPRDEGPSQGFTFEQNATIEFLQTIPYNNEYLIDGAS